MKNRRGTRARLFQKAVLSTLLKETDTIKKIKSTQLFGGSDRTLFQQAEQYAAGRMLFCFSHAVPQGQGGAGRGEG